MLGRNLRIPPLSREQESGGVRYEKDLTMADIAIVQPTRTIKPMLIMLPILVILILGGWLGWQAFYTHSESGSRATTVSTQEFEAKWGIRITLIGVTADGGLVDLRYQVIDAQKAGTIATDKTTVPTLIDEQTGTEIASSVMSHSKHVIVAGQTYFQLYRNPQGAIQHGHPVTVKIGDIQIAHLIAQ